MAGSDNFKPALIIVDMQNDFCPPDGSLAVTGARDLAPKINELMSLPFAMIITTQDWHPQNHISFASNHPPPNNKPLTSFATLKNPRPADRREAGEPDEKEQRLWPDHCVQGTKGAEVIEELDTDKVDVFVKKGMDEEMEMYSAFSSAFSHFDCHGKGVSHDLASILKDKGITHVYNVGVAGDYCVKSTAIDGAKSGCTSYVVTDCVRGVDEGEGGWGRAIKELQKAGVELISMASEEISRVKSLKK